MKKIIATLVILSVSMLVPQMAQSQSFLKKLGKEVGKAVVNEVKDAITEPDKKKEDAKPAQTAQPAQAAQPAAQAEQPKAAVVEDTPQEDTFVPAPSTASAPLAVYACRNPKVLGVEGKVAKVEADGLIYWVSLDKNCATVVKVAPESQKKTTTVKVYQSINYQNKLYPVTVIGSQAFVGEPMTSISLPEGLIQINSKAFAQASKLQDIHLPFSLEVIGVAAFEGSGLTTVDVPSKVTKIGSRAFAECKALTEADLTPDNLTLGSGLFENCTALVKAMFPLRQDAIPSKTFKGCTALTKFNFTMKIKSIGDNAFEGAGLTSVHIPLEIKSIGNGAYRAMPSLTSVHIPSTVESFGEGVFEECKALNSISIHQKHKDYEKMVKIFGKSSTNILVSEDLDKCPAIKWTN